MSTETHITLNTLLILLVALVQFLLRRGPQPPYVQELEIRLAEAEQRLEEILRRLEQQATNHE